MKRIVWGLVFACAGAILASSVLGATPQDSRKLTTRFSHKLHVGDNGIKCKKCHKTDDARATMPEFKVCAKCHDGIDPEKPKDKRATVYLKNDKPRWSAFAKQPDDVKFLHKAHVAKLQCDACHGVMAENEAVDEKSIKKIAMAACQECHAKDGRKEECKDCHKAIDKTSRPKSHKVGKAKWLRAHGPISVAEETTPSGQTGNNCALCHTPEGCLSCHQKVKPMSHAAKDWKTCLVGGPKSANQGGHCKSCHLPLEKSGSCKACHKQATHPKAPSPPQCNGCHGSKPAHNGGGNCKQCHTAAGMKIGHHTVALSHPDQVGECGDCHKD